MPRHFLYARVSTVDQTTDNQVLEAAQAGFQFEPRRVVAETISGRVPAAKRPGFAKLLDRLEPGDTLVVTKLDRLGRDTSDVVDTVSKLDSMGVHVHCLALAGADLTSAAGKLHMTILAAVASFERDILIERTHAGLARAKADGKRLGRKASLTDVQVTEIRAKLAAGATARGLAKEYKVSHPTILKAVSDC
ncbi:recombinase family protein [Bordetella sp. 02P26C-1]|uniref:recombinase family protein n=1 Tax=Bordetella sp. 02P26C-1 TaxID=2683195 RepID=UPI0013542BA5|nr:recombinase family protein [Bordetella sp. 02P26C-1]MVW80117.1 recombinase family protein [Bordetella sp. 02P26C-1]